MRHNGWGSYSVRVDAPYTCWYTVYVSRVRCRLTIEEYDTGWDDSEYDHGEHCRWIGEARKANGRLTATLLRATSCRDLP